MCPLTDVLLHDSVYYLLALIPDKVIFVGDISKHLPNWYFHTPRVLLFVRSMKQFIYSASSAHALSGQNLSRESGMCRLNSIIVSTSIQPNVDEVYRFGRVCHFSLTRYFIS